MASSIACSTTDLSIDLSRATASAICSNSVRLAAMAAMSVLLSARVLARFQIFFDEFVGEHELGFCNVGVRKCKTRPFDLKDDVGAVQSQKPAFETLAPVSAGRLQFDLRFVPGPTREIGQPRQRTVDAGRRYFEHVLALDRVFPLEKAGESARQRGAIFDIHRAVGALGHDLKRLAVSAHQSQAHKSKTRGFHGGLYERLQLRHGA